MFERKTKVLMLKSVGSIVAGHTVRLPVEQADEFIVKGYAEGELSREYSEEERAELRGPTQIVSL